MSVRLTRLLVIWVLLLGSGELVTLRKVAQDPLLDAGTPEPTSFEADIFQHCRQALFSFSAV